MHYKRWEIWLAEVKFEDNPDEIKIRPVLIVAQQEMLLIAYKMTRTKRINDYSIINWVESGLDKQTHIITELRIRLHEKSLKTKIGNLHPNDIIKFLEHISKSN